MATGPRILNGKVVLQVYLLDNSMKTLLVEPTTTVADVCSAMAEKIGFGDPEDDSLCFSLHESLDGATISRALAPDSQVLATMETWFGKPDARFIYMCKLYTDTIINSKDPKIIHMLFIQAVYNVISGAFPTLEKDVITLAALQFQARFGPHNPATHKPGFLTSTIMEYVPLEHLQKSGKTVTQWEELIFHKHAFSTTHTPRETFLATLSKRDYYGAVLFAVKQKYDRKLPRRMYFAISRRGITLLKLPTSSMQDGMETIATYPLADIYRWAYKPEVNFYFEIKGDKPTTEGDNVINTYETPEGKHMSDLLTDYALALLREMGLNPDGSKRVRKAGGEAGGAAGSTAPPAAPPARAAMATTADAYKGVKGDVGALASAATRSGEYGEAAPATSTAATGGAGVPPIPPPPPPAFVPPPPPPAAPKPAGLPPNWIECTDESSGDVYFFNEVTGGPPPPKVWQK